MLYEAMKKPWQNIIIGVVLGILLVPLAGFIFVASGGFPVSTKSPSLPLEEYLAHKALKAALKDEKNVASPLQADEVNLLAGAKIYRNNCAVCHGLPGQAGSAISMGLFPSPPWFFEADQGIEHDPVGETFWVVKNGIRLTGMPGFQDNLKDEEMWQVTLLLNVGKNLSESVKKVLAAP